jgi:hypothetical protein
LALFSSLLAAGVSTAGEAAPSSDGDRCSDRCTNRSKRPDEVDDSSGGGDSETVFLPLTSSSRLLEPARGGSGGGGGGGGGGGFGFGGGFTARSESVMIDDEDCLRCGFAVVFAAFVAAVLTRLRKADGSGFDEFKFRALSRDCVNRSLAW